MSELYFRCSISRRVDGTKGAKDAIELAPAEIYLQQRRQQQQQQQLKLVMVRQRSSNNPKRYMSVSNLVLGSQHDAASGGRGRLHAAGAGAAQAPKFSRTLDTPWSIDSQKDQ